MLNHSSKKNGYTLVEVLVVVSIMGILSTMGVASLRGAVINSRIKDHAMNTAAFLERMANEANRMSRSLCVAYDNDQRITAYMSSDCDNGNLTDDSEFATFEIEPPAKFGCDAQISMDDYGPDWIQNGALFVPRIGLSAAPSEGHICMQYGSSDAYGLVYKQKNNNMMIPMWRTSSDLSWTKL